MRSPYSAALMAEITLAGLALGSLRVSAETILRVHERGAGGDTPLMLAAALFMAGACDAVTDVAQNAHGLRVQRLYGRSIVNSLHGVWSIGAVLGGLMGSAAVGLSLPLHLHKNASA